MQVLRQASDLTSSRQRVCLAIGFFDGVHLGHQQIIRQTVADARLNDAAPVVVTFDQHPSTIVAPQRVPPLIQTRSQRLASIASLGAEALLLVPFDVEFSRRPGEQFIRELAQGFGRIVSICVGAGFTFGHQRSGNVELLRRLGQELHYHVHGLAAVSLDGEVVSSTRIREAIRKGQLDEAGQMLGRTYALAGQVQPGRQLGRQLGFPTANLDVSGIVLPPAGVYAARALVGTQTHRAAVNIGVRPTLPGSQPSLSVEAHLLDYDADLYGSEIELTLMQKLRDEVKFNSLEALRAQIREDVASVRRLLD